MREYVIVMENISNAGNIENYNLLLPIFYSRINHLANVIHAVNGFVVSVLIAILAISLSDKITNPLNFQIILILCIIFLCFWRYYAHKIDDEIIELYHKILFCESSLNVREEVALVTSLISKYPPKLQNEFKKLSLNERYRKLSQLTKWKIVGFRGHDSFDLLAILLIMICLFFSVYGLNYSPNFTEILSAGLLALFYSFFCVGYYLILRKNPSSLNEIDMIIQTQQSNAFFILEQNKKIIVYVSSY
jgi:hypothetical protein